MDVAIDSRGCICSDSCLEGARATIVPTFPPPWSNRLAAGGRFRQIGWAKMKEVRGPSCARDSARRCVLLTISLSFLSPRVRATLIEALLSFPLGNVQSVSEERVCLTTRRLGFQAWTFRASAEQGTRQRSATPLVWHDMRITSPEMTSLTHRPRRTASED